MTRERIPQQIWVLIGASFIIALGFGLITPVLPRFAQSFGVGATASSIVVSIFAFFRLLGGPLGGRLISRLGERPIYLMGLLIVAASSFATAFAHSYWQLLVYRGVGGIGSVMFTISATALVVRHSPPSIRGRVSSAYASAFLLGGICGPILGGTLGSLGLRVPFIAYAGFLVLAAAVVATFVHRERVGGLGAASHPKWGIREAWQHPSYRAALGTSFANGWTNFGVRSAILPLFAAAVIGDQPWVAGLALGVYAAGNALGLTASGRLSDRRGRRPFILTGLLISASATAVTGWVGGLVSLIIVSVIAGMGSGVLNPPLQAAMADLIGRERNGGAALAAFQMSADAGMIVGPIVAGVLVDRGSFALAFGVCALLLVLAAAAWWHSPETHPVTASGQAPAEPPSERDERPLTT